MSAFLYACPASSFDRSSGAALIVRTVLGALAARGHRASALQATIFDTRAGAEGAASAIQVGDPTRFFRLEHGGVEHFVVPTKESALGRMTADEEETFLQFFKQLVDERPPDVLLTWGGRILDRALRAEARRRRIRVVFFALNSEYHRAETFVNTDVVATCSQATAALYRERLGLVAHSLGTLIDPAGCKASARTPRYVTFINPLPAKGLALFAAIARRALTELPEARFLVVESRGTWSSAAALLRFDPREFTNVHVSAMRADMRAVYANTRVLLVPSLWHEAGPRVVGEALMNGIPVLGSRSGGIPENLAGSGYAFEVPQAVQSNWGTIAPDEAVTEWMEKLERMLRDEAFYAAECSRARTAAAYHDLNRGVSRLLDLAAPPRAMPWLK